MDLKKVFSIPPSYYQSKHRLNEVCSRDSLFNKIKYGAHIINLDEYSGIGTYGIALCTLNNKVTYFASFDVEHILKKN